MGNAERKEPLLLAGPKGLEKVVSALRMIAPDLPFPLVFKEFSEKEEEFTAGPYRIKAFKVNHNITCYGYQVSIDRIGKFDVQKALTLGLPKQLWGVLQKGQKVAFEGKEYEPSMVLGESRKGLKVVYCTDTRPVSVIAEAAQDADLFICEGMYGEPDKIEKAKEYRHMTFYEAANLAKQAQANRVWLTHYSPSLVYPSNYIDAARKIYSKMWAAKDGQSVELKFEDEE
jgi:ribonuclease Z